MMLRLLSVPRPRCDWQVTVAMALVFATMALFLATRDNDFPFAFHPDEESKIVQVQTGDYDFHHPLLMLRAAGLVEALIPVDGTPEQIKQAGRWISALCAAGAVFCLVLIASELGGAIAGLVAGLFLALNHALFELAHYFKEDTAFLFGVSLFLLTLVLYGRAPVKRRAAALGAALGVAASAKYTAVILVPIAVGAVAIAGRRQPWQQLLVGMLSCIGVWLIVNWPLVTQLVSAHEAVLRELHLATGGHAGIGREVPHGYYLWLARVTVNPVAWLLVLVYLLALVPRRREVSGAEWVVAAFPFAFGLMLSFFPQVSYRYFLPGTALLLVLAGLGAGTLTRLCWRDRAILAGQRAWLWGGLVILAGLVAQLPVTIDYYQGFAATLAAAWRLTCSPRHRRTPRSPKTMPLRSSTSICRTASGARVSSPIWERWTCCAIGIFSMWPLPGDALDGYSATGPSSRQRRGPTFCAVGPSIRGCSRKASWCSSSSKAR